MWLVASLHCVIMDRRWRRGPFSTLWFKDATVQIRFDEYKDKKVYPGRFLNISFLESISFPYLAQFKEFGWMNFLEVRGEYSEMILKHFYINDEMLENVDGVTDRIATYVKGMPIVVDAKLILDLYDVPFSGVAFGGTFTLLEACRVVHEDRELIVPRKDVAS
ncbi:Uncharacterized protein Adt_02499 [Abeliophyllum distichum]|uniref:Uncharacterized protein n=1 Tax=Abeliophyllum distichum TaxID=126358 RepID=A0ABD1VWA4_9LAMI